MIISISLTETDSDYFISLYIFWQRCFTLLRKLFNYMNICSIVLVVFMQIKHNYIFSVMKMNYTTHKGEYIQNLIVFSLHHTNIILRANPAKSYVLLFGSQNVRSWMVQILDIKITSNNSTIRKWKNFESNHWHFVTIYSPYQHGDLTSVL